MSFRVSYSLVPLKSRFPVVSANSMTPTANTSLRQAMGSPRACSGDMYGTLPLR